MSCWWSLVVIIQLGPVSYSQRCYLDNCHQTTVAAGLLALPCGWESGHNSKIVLRQIIIGLLQINICSGFCRSFQTFWCTNSTKFCFYFFTSWRIISDSENSPTFLDCIFPFIIFYLDMSYATLHYCWWRKENVDDIFTQENPLKTNS